MTLTNGQTYYFFAGLAMDFKDSMPVVSPMVKGIRWVMGPRAARSLPHTELTDSVLTIAHKKKPFVSALSRFTIVHKKPLKSASVFYFQNDFVILLIFLYTLLMFTI